jgi:hypothetical protein
VHHIDFDAMFMKQIKDIPEVVFHDERKSRGEIEIKI